MNHVSTFRAYQPAFALKRISIGKNSMFDVLFIILGGLPFYMPFFLWVGEYRVAQHIPIDWALWGNQIVSLPHVFATYARLTRKIEEKKVSYWVGWPAWTAILILLIGTSFYTFNGYKVVLYVLTAVNVWQSYHYLRQVYGISRYLGRDYAQTEMERTLLFWAYHGAMPLFVFGRWNTINILWHGKASDAIIPVGFPAPFMTVCWALAGIAVAMGIAAEVLRYKRSTTYNCTNVLTLGTYYVMHWYGFVSITYNAIGFLAITVWHAVQYLGMVWKLEDRQNCSRMLGTKVLKLVPSGLSFLLFGVFLYITGDFIENHIFTIGNIYFPQFAAMCLSTISAHHYLSDTFIWGRKAGM